MDKDKDQHFKGNGAEGGPKPKANCTGIEHNEESVVLIGW